MGSQLTDLIRKKYPGHYDDMSDDDLEKAVLDKHPEYKDLATPSDVKPTEAKSSKVDTEPIKTEEPKTADETKPNFKTSVSATTDQPSEGWFSKGYHALTDPLTDAPSRFAHSVSNYITTPKLDESPTMAMIKGAVGGGLEGIGNLVSGATSPLNLATMGMAGAEGVAGKAGLESIASLMNAGQKVAALPMVGHGGYEMLRPDATMGERGQGLAELAGGFAAGLHGGETPNERPIARMPETMRPEVLDEMRAGRANLPPDLLPVDAATAAMGAPKHADVDELMYNHMRDKFDMGQNLPSDIRQTSLIKPDEANRVLTGDVVNEGAPPIRTPTGNFFIDDAHRMEDEALSRRADPIRAAEDKAKNDEWWNRNKEINIYEGRFNEPNTKPIPDEQLTPEQLAVRQSYKAMQEHSDEHARKFSEEEEKLPEGEYYKEPAAQRMKYETEHKELQDRHDEIVQDYKNSIASDEGIKKPTATFKGWQEGAEDIPDSPLYDIQGGSHDKSTVTPEGLRKLGIDIPETPPNDLASRRASRESMGSTLNEPQSMSNDVSEVADSTRTRLGKKLSPEEQAKADKANKIQQIFDAPRGLMSVDPPFITSAAFRQAGKYAGTKEWFKAWGEAAKAYSSKDIADAQATTRATKPLFMPRTLSNGETGPSYAEQVGLKMGDLSKYTKRDEQIRGEIAEKIPVYGRAVAASNRAYNSFINHIAETKFTDMVNNAAKLSSEGTIGGFLNRPGETPNPLTDLTAGKKIADFVNTSLNRGKLGLEVGNYEVNLERHAKLLANTFFSPRGIASQIRMLNPSTYMMANPEIRKQALTAITRQVALWWGIAELASWGGAKVSHDPTSADFGKIRIGNSRIDVPGGLQQYLVLGARQAPQSVGGGGVTNTDTNQFTPFGHGYKPQTRASQIIDFGINRLHPTMKTAYDFLSASESKPFHVMDKSLQAIAPMFADDLMGVAQDNPELAPLILGASGSGMGTQSYERGSYGKPVFIPESMDINIGAKSRERR